MKAGRKEVGGKRREEEEKEKKRKLLDCRFRHRQEEAVWLKNLS